jgi:mono/diheme cytochrome c family protein
MDAAPATNPSAKRNRRNAPVRRAASLGWGIGLALGLAQLGIAAGPAFAEEAAVSRGAYLAAAAGCDTCHTDSKNGGATYAGGRLMETEFGAIATPNITPDAATGIGGWSEADFARAMRWGIAPDGTHYLPTFPFSYFARLTNGDLADLKAFLDSLKPVARPNIVGAASLALLSRARAAIGVAIAANSAAGRELATGDPAVVRGAYLVAAVGRCGDCHTPLTWLGAPDTARFLAGSRGGIEGKKAPGITTDPKNGIGSWSEDDIASLLKDGGTPDGDFVGGAMADIVRNTSRLTEDDRRAIAAYLKTVPSKAFAKND